MDNIKQQFAAIAGASFVAISQLATASTSNVYQHIVVIVFFATLPLSVVGFTSIDQFDGPNAKPYWILRLLGAVSAGLFTGAMTLLAYSFGHWTGIGFMLTVIVIAPFAFWFHT